MNSRSSRSSICSNFLSKHASIAAVGFVFIVGCDALLEYRVVVVDEYGRPIRNATVEIRGSGSPSSSLPFARGKTGDDGVFRGGMTCQEGAKFDLAVTADGFETYLKKLPAARIKNEVRSQLKPGTLPTK